MAREKKVKGEMAIRLSRGDKVFLFLNDFYLFIALLLVAYPMIYIISASFSSPRAVMSARVVLWPVEPSLQGYEAVFQEKRIVSGYLNTILYTVVGTVINIIFTIMAAYPLSRKDFYGRSIFMYLFSFTMIFSGGLIPTYLVIKDLGMVNTRWAMWIPGAIGVWNLILMRTNYQNTISDELMEAAMLDGCSHIQFLYRIVLPLTKAITAVLVLFYAVGHWNSFFTPFIYLSKSELFPLQIILREILLQNTISSDLIVDPRMQAAKAGLADLLKYSLIIVSSLPVWIAYPFVQKYFVKGVMIGAIKG